MLLQRGGQRHSFVKVRVMASRWLCCVGIRLGGKTVDQIYGSLSLRPQNRLTTLCSTHAIQLIDKANTPLTDLLVQTTNSYNLKTNASVLRPPPLLVDHLHDAPVTTAGKLQHAARRTLTIPAHTNGQQAKWGGAGGGGCVCFGEGGYLK